MNGIGENPDREAGDTASGGRRGLTDREAAELTEHIARLTQTGVPLGQGLRAAAKEASGAALASTLDYLADQLEKGRPLDEVLSSSDTRLPDYIRRLISAAIQSGKVDQVLLELMDHFRCRRDLRRSVLTALSYPALLLLVVSGLAAILFGLVIPQFRVLLEDFGHTGLVGQTQFLLWFADEVVPALLACLTALAVLGLIVRMLGGRALWRRLLWGVPIFGRLLSWSGTSELTRLLRILLEHGIQLPEALRLSSEGVHDANVSMAAQVLAADVESGTTLHDALGHTSRLPESVIPIVRWGEKTDNLPDALRAASELLDGRVRLRSLWLTSVFPPLTFVLVGLLIVAVVGGLLGPLVLMMRYLTSFTPVIGNQLAVYEPIGTGLFSLPIIGAALLLAVKISYLRRLTAGDDALILALTVAGWCLLMLGLLGTMCYLAFPLGFFVWLVTMVIIAMVVSRFRDSERRSLLWVLAVSAERGLPLAPAARAFAAERADELGRRVMRLASLLEAGIPLTEALNRSGNRLPTDALLAARVGGQTQGIGVLLKQVARDHDRIRPIWQSAYEKSLYFVVLLAVATASIAFLAIKIIPTFETIFSDFGIALPAVTVAAIRASDAFAHFGAFAVPFFLLLLGICGIGVLYYMGWMWWEPRILYWFTRQIHGANIMRSLSHTLSQGMSMVDSLDLLRRCYPGAHVISRLASACNRVEQGREWCDALRQTGLIAKSDAAVLRAAQRVGNLPWALHEMADSSIRRLAYRMTVLHQVAFPIVIFAFALPVAWCAVAIMWPLAQLVEILSHG